MIITSVNNNKVKYWGKLKQKKYRNQQHEFLIEGHNLVIEALKKNLVKELIVEKGYEDYDFTDTIVVDTKVMKKISSTNSSPKVMAVCKYLNYSDNNLERVILLDNIQDPGNLGTIIRSAVAFNCSLIVLGDDTVDLYNDKVLRSSGGMIFNIPIISHNLEDYISKLKHNNIKIYGTALTDAVLLTEVSVKTPWALVMGNEGNGVNPILLSLTDENVKIPMNKNCESLNVGVATSVILYEFDKSR